MYRKSTDILSERLNGRAVSLALLAAALWGGNAVTIKMALKGVPPITLAGIRFFIGGLSVLTWARVNRIPVIMKRGERGELLLLSLLFAVQILLLNQGTQFTLASRAAVLISTYPFFVALFAHLFVPGERIRALQTVGMLLSFAGVVLVFIDGGAVGDFVYLRGDFMVLSSGFLLGARQVVIKRISQRIHPYRLLLWQAALSLPVFFALSFVLERGEVEHLDMSVVAAILYQGIVVAGFCFILWVSLLRRHSPSRLGAFGFVTPVFGVFLSNLLLVEPLSSRLLLSALLVGAGITIVNATAAS